MESQMHGTPVLGADIGGIPELIKDGETGELFESGNAEQLKEKILSLWNDEARLSKYSLYCNENKFLTVEKYCDELFNLYGI